MPSERLPLATGTPILAQNAMSRKAFGVEVAYELG